MAKKETGKKNTARYRVDLKLSFQVVAAKKIAVNDKFPAIFFILNRLGLRVRLLFIRSKIFDGHPPASRAEDMRFAG
jgi:hypothetical protein